MGVQLLISAVRIAAASYLGICLVVYLRQYRYVYYPDRTVEATPADDGLPFEPVELRTADGETLAAWYVPADPAGALAGRLTVLFCHGNAGDMADRLWSLRTFHDMGLNTLLFDYRGYGDSTGSPSEAGTARDARAAWDYLTAARGCAPGTIVLFGRSLGAAVALQLAPTCQPAAVVIESAFTSAPDMAARLFPILPGRLLSRFRYDNRAAIRRLRTPVYVMHSPEDSMVPYEMGRALFEAAPEPKRFHALRGDHNAGGLDALPAAQADLAAFLAALLPRD